MTYHSDISKRKGRILISRDVVLEGNADVLREIFSNFFPVDVGSGHRIEYWDSIRYYGFSPYFEEVEEAASLPTYKMWFVKDKDGNTKFDKMTKCR